MSDTTGLRRMRLPLDHYDTDLILVGDRFEEGGRYIQMEIRREESERWTWLDWDDMYDRLARQWQNRFAREVASP